ncbi:hypothetical protein NEMIN01_2266 [Nematocida minor]|uniref:uncharacterized protein n=1 Tax=Nematocida minor TaxID=1912983 RepID=UPI00221EBEE0|nr:uncharacterized protein NEMIN01_2266 [Nematocida minor]KAI5192886.1 hypothetical protein NEMIN01_2266 [Nematocida minor]
MSTQYTRDQEKKGLFGVLSRCIEIGDLSALKRIVDREMVDISKIQNAKKSTLLHVAAKYNRERIVMYLMEAGASMHQQNRRNECPYFIAVARGSRRVLRYMEAMMK